MKIRIKKRKVFRFKPRLPTVNQLVDIRKREKWVTECLGGKSIPYPLAYLVGYSKGHCYWLERGDTLVRRNRGTLICGGCRTLFMDRGEDNPCVTKNNAPIKSL